MKEKGCDLVKQIQDDKLFESKSNFKDLQKVREKTPSHRFAKLDLPYNTFKSSDRSISVVGT